MMSFDSRSIINGNMLKNFVGLNVSIMLRVEDTAGTNLIAMTTNNQKVRVSLPESIRAEKGDWVEVIGAPTGSDAIRAKEVIQFGGEKVDFDEESYNMLVMFLNNAKDIFKSHK